MNNGQFPKGRSGNPGGRPTMPSELRVKCRDLTAKALETLEAAMTEGDSTSSRVRAAEMILAYGWGRPAERVSIEAAEPARPFEKLTTEQLAALADRVKTLQAFKATMRAEGIASLELPNESASPR